MVRVKWSATTTTGFRYSAAFLSTAGTSGSLLGRLPSGTDSESTTTTRACRVSTTPAYNRVSHTGSYGDTTTWRHFAMTYDASGGGTITYYIDGVSIGTVASAATLVANSNGAVWHGIAAAKTADLALFNRALSAGEVASMAAYRETQVTSGLVGFWRLDSDGTDSSGNSNTLSNAGSGSAYSFSTSDNPPQPERPPVDVAGAITTTATIGGVPSLWRYNAGAVTSTAALTGTPNLIRNQAGAISSTATLAANPNLIRNNAGAVTSTATLAGAAVQVLGAAGAVSATATLAGAAVQVLGGAGAVAATATLAGTPEHVFGAAGALASTATLEATPQHVFAAAGALTSTATLTGNADQVLGAAGALTATATLAGAPAQILGAAGAITATATLAGDPDVDTPATDVAGALASTATLSGTPQVTFAAAGAMGATVTLAGLSEGRLAAAGDITATAVLAGAPELRLGAAGSLAAAATLAGNAVQIQAAAGALTSAATLAGAAVQVIGAAGSITAAAALSGDPEHTHAAAGALATTATLTGNADLISSVVDFTGRRFTDYANYNTATWNFDASLDWSVCGWLYIVESAGSGNQGDVFYSEDTGNPGNTSAIRLGYTSDAGADPALRFRVPGLNLTIPTTVATWVHMALTYDGTTARAYVDGAEVGSATVSATFTHNRVDLGSFHFNDDVIVEIAQVKSWLGTALTAPELADEIAYWTPQTTPGDVVAWWQLRNPDPTLDSSGNGYTLVEVGFAPDLPGEIPVPGALVPTVVYDVAGAITTTATLAGAAVQVFTAAGALSATASLTGAPNLIRAAAGAVVATATLAGAPTVTRAGAGAISATVVLTGAAQRIAAPVFGGWVDAAGTGSPHGAWAMALEPSAATHTPWSAPMEPSAAHGAWTP
jgi:hypothetical protein